MTQQNLQHDQNILNDLEDILLDIKKGSITFEESVRDSKRMLERQEAELDEVLATIEKDEQEITSLLGPAAV